MSKWRPCIDLFECITTSSPSFSRVVSPTPSPLNLRASRVWRSWLSKARRNSTQEIHFPFGKRQMATTFAHPQSLGSSIIKIATNKTRRSCDACSRGELRKGHLSKLISNHLKKKNSCSCILIYSFLITHHHLLHCFFSSNSS